MGVADHFVAEVGANDVKLTQERFLEDGAGAAERVEDDCGGRPLSTVSSRNGFRTPVTIHDSLLVVSGTRHKWLRQSSTIHSLIMSSELGLCRCFEMRGGSWADSRCFEGEVEHDLCQFRWEHADKSVALGFAMVTASVGGDVLGTAAFGDND